MKKVKEIKPELSFDTNDFKKCRVNENGSLVWEEVKLKKN